MLAHQYGFLRKCKQYFVYGLISFGCLFILQSQEYFVIIINSFVQLSLTKASSSSRWPEPPIAEDRYKTMTAQCEQSNNWTADIKNDAPSSWLRAYPWLNSALFPVASKSLLYCAVPKVASKSLISLILYVYVRDVISHLNNNQTGNRARVEPLINIPKLIDQLGKNGVPISGANVTHSVPSLLETYLHLLRYEGVNATSDSLFFNPWRLDLKQIFPAIHFASVSNVSELLSHSFTRVLFVRHPFERLASAYQERIAILAKDRIQPEPHYDQVRSLICELYVRFIVAQRPLLRRQPCDNVIPAFKHFVRFILAGTETPTGIANMDGHWKPFTAICQTCRMQYNFIGKYETFDQDFSALLQRLNVSDWNNHKRRGASGYSRRYYQQLYTSLPDELICRLKNLYKEDINLFNYRIEDYVNRPTLMCPT